MQVSEPDVTVAEIVTRTKRHLGLEENVEPSCTEVTRHTNFNYVFRVSWPDGAVIVKVVPSQPKRFAIDIPRERIAYEAGALERFSQLCRGHLNVPQVMFLDRQAFLLGMSDVGQGREVVLDVIDKEYPVFAACAEALGRGVGLVHAGTWHTGTFRSEDEESHLRTLIIDGLIGPGCQALFPQHWPAIARQMRKHCLCLVHSDLWGKNILIGRGRAPSLVDFEGALTGDPAFDVATLLTVALIPVLENPLWERDFFDFTEGLLKAYSGCFHECAVAQSTTERAFQYVAAFLAARGYGPFAYPFSALALQRLNAIALSILTRCPRDLEGFRRTLADAGEAQIVDR